MSNEKLVAAKKLYNVLEDFLSSSDLELAMSKRFPEYDVKPSRIFFLETLGFAVFIASADGEISMREANIINYIAGSSLSTSEMKEILNNSKVEHMILEHQLTCKILCEIENLLYRKDAISIDSSLMNILITYFETVGELVADADDYLSSMESSRIKNMST